MRLAIDKIILREQKHALTESPPPGNYPGGGVRAQPPITPTGKASNQWMKRCTSAPR